MQKRLLLGINKQLACAKNQYAKNQNLQSLAEAAILCTCILNSYRLPKIAAPSSCGSTDAPGIKVVLCQLQSIRFTWQRIWADNLVGPDQRRVLFFLKKRSPFIFLKYHCVLIFCLTPKLNILSHQLSKQFKLPPHLGLKWL